MEKKRNQSDHASLKKPSNKISSTLLDCLRFYHKLPSDFPLEQEIEKFNIFWNEPRLASLNLDGRLQTFAKERHWTNNDRMNFRIRGAIKNGRTLTSDRTARECLIALIARKDGQGNWVYKYECRKCGSVDQRGITQGLSQYRYKALETLPGQKEIKKCPNCGEYVEFKKVRARTHWWEREKYRRKSKRIAERGSIWDTPVLDSERKRWEKLNAQKRYKELYKELGRKIEALLLKNKDLIDELLNPDFLRRSFMGKLGIPYSPLLGLYSLTAYILVRLFGIKNEKLFEELLTHVKKVYTMRHGAPRGPDDQQERFSDLGTYLTEAIAGFSKKPVLFSRKTSSLLVEAVERYLFTCVENAIKKDQMSEQKFEELDIEDLRAEPKSRAAMLAEASTELIFSDPIDKIIYENYWETGLKIVDIVYKRLGKRITRQAIENRKAKNIKPFIERSLELKKIRREDEGRIEEKPVRGAPEDEEASGDKESLKEEKDETENET